MIKLAGLEHEVEGLLQRWPGLAAVAIGLGLAFFGVAQASKVAILQRGQMRRICVLPERIGGALTALGGLALVAGGLLHMTSPVLLDKVATFRGRSVLGFLGH